MAASDGLLRTGFGGMEDVGGGVGGTFGGGPGMAAPRMPFFGGGGGGCACIIPTLPPDGWTTT